MAARLASLYGPGCLSEARSTSACQQNRMQTFRSSIGGWTGTKGETRVNVFGDPIKGEARYVSSSASITAAVLEREHAKPINRRRADGLPDYLEAVEQPIKLIATDVDGTLLDSQQRLSERAERAIKMAVEQGVQVLVATGKARGPWVAQVFARLQLTTPVVFLQGLLIYDADWNVLYGKTMELDVARRVIQFAKEEGLTHMVYSDDRILCEACDKHTDRMIGYGEPVPEPLGPLLEVIDDVPVHKILYAGDDQALLEVRSRLEAELAGEATLVTALNGFLEFLPPGTSKGGGVKWVLDRLGVQPEHVMAIGDGENDIEMIQMVGFGVAMGNANPRVKKVAKFVTQSNDNEGFARAVERLALQPGYWCWD